MIATLNETIFFWLHEMVGMSAGFDAVVVFVAAYADTLILSAAVLFLAWFYIRHRHDPRAFVGKMMGDMLATTVTVSLAWIVAAALKAWIASPRPFVTFPMLEPLFLYGSHDSFPSGHATIFFALATAIWFSHRWAGAAFFVAAILISIARVMVGIHYPVDILAGAIIGILVAALLHQVLRKYIQPLLSRYLFRKN
jgi:undecaprenyl-diphosphatase